jgi:hypothetical protein
LSLGFLKINYIEIIRLVYRLKEIISEDERWVELAEDRFGISCVQPSDSANTVVV